MKKRFIMLFAVMAMLCCLPIIAQAETGTKYGDYLYYEVNSDETGITITDCDTAATEIVIPDEIGGLPVTVIGISAFEGCASLTSITIPYSITNINHKAFNGCTGLDKVYISDMAAYLNISFSQNPMQYANKLYLNNKRVTSVDIPDGVSQIPDYAFCGCDSITSVTIPDSVTRIGLVAFSGCSGLTSITIGNGVTNIDNGAFSGCKGLTNITIPDNVTSIASDAFDNCVNITTLNFNAIECSVSNTSIPRHYLFIDCSLTTVNIGEKVTKIPPDIFSGCKGITNVTIPDRVTSIGFSAFEDCSSLTSITIGRGVTNISGSAFENCSGLTSIIIGSGVACIGSSAFHNCSNLTNITIPDRVTSIGTSAFDGCCNLTNITIPNSVTSIGKFAFRCINLTTLNYNAQKVFNVFSGCSKLATVVLGDNVENIDTDAFASCEKLERIFIPTSVTEIESGAFSGCSNLTTVEYGGSESEWNDIYIGNNNDYLKNATIHYNSTGIAVTPTPNPDVVNTSVDTYEISDIQPTENGIKLTVKTNETVSGKQVILVACYDENGAFVGLEWQDITASPTEQTVNVDIDKENTASVKAFIWNALDYMMPASYPASLEL